MRESIHTDNGLVRLDLKPGDIGDEPRGRQDLTGLDAGVTGEVVTPRAKRHDDLLERGVTGALTQAVNGALDLSRPFAHRGERVGDRHTEVVVAMHRPDRLVRVRDSLAQLANESGKLPRHVVPNGIRDIDGSGTRGDGRLNDAAEEIRLGAAGILGRELHVIAEIARPLDRHHRPLNHFIGA